MLPFIIFAIVILAVIIGIYASYRYEKKRTEQLTELAESLGLVFLPQGDDQLDSIRRNFQLFNQGHSRKVSNVLCGETDEVKLAIFDYTFTVGSGKNSSTHRQTISTIQSPDFNIPEFTMRPEGFLDSIGGMLGFQDIDFDNHPEFSNAFVLKSSQEDRVRQFFNKPVLDYFAKHSGISVEARPGHLIFFRNNRRVKPDDMKQMLADTYEVYGLFADRLAQEQSQNANVQQNLMDDVREQYPRD